MPKQITKFPPLAINQFFFQMKSCMKLVRVYSSYLFIDFFWKCWQHSEANSVWFLLTTTNASPKASDHYVIIWMRRWYDKQILAGKTLGIMYLVLISSKPFIWCTKKMVVSLDDLQTHFSLILFDTNNYSLPTSFNC